MSLQRWYANAKVGDIRGSVDNRAPSIRSVFGSELVSVFDGLMEAVGGIGRDMCATNLEEGRSRIPPAQNADVSN